MWRNRATPTRTRPALAHLARDVAYAIEGGEDVLPMRLKLWPHKAFGLARDIETLAASTIASRRRAWNGPSRTS